MNRPREIVRGFANTPYTLHACAVMPEHVHLVIGYSPRNIRRVVGHLKSEATRALRECGYYLDKTPWAEHGWNVYLNADEDVFRAIRYVEQNPVREGKRFQSWVCRSLWRKRGTSSAAKYYLAAVLAPRAAPARNPGESGKSFPNLLARSIGATLSPRPI